LTAVTMRSSCPMRRIQAACDALATAMYLSPRARAAAEAGYTPKSRARSAVCATWRRHHSLPTAKPTSGNPIAAPPTSKPLRVQRLMSVSPSV
jgi:hypothetical protein